MVKIKKKITPCTWNYMKVLLDSRLQKIKFLNFQRKGYGLNCHEKRDGEFRNNNTLIILHVLSDMLEF